MEKVVKFEEEREKNQAKKYLKLPKCFPIFLNIQQSTQIHSGLKYE
jgi:hypothetical protein